MRLFRCLALLLSLAAPAAFAGGPYQVELVVFRQAGDAVPSSQPAPDDWATGAQPLASDALRATALDNQARQAQPGQRLHRAAAQGLAPGHRRDPGEDRPQRRPGTGSSFPGGRYADPQPGALRRHGGRFLGQSLRRRRFPRRQPAHQAGHAAEEWRTDLSRPSEPGHPDQGGAGRRPSRRPQSHGNGRTAGTGGRAPVEGGFDAAPPAQ